LNYTTFLNQFGAIIGRYNMPITLLVLSIWRWINCKNIVNAMLPGPKHWSIKFVMRVRV